MEDKGETKAMEVEAKVVPMVVAPMQPDAPGFSTLPALSPPDSTADSGPSSTKTKMERQEVDLGPLSNARCFILSDVFTPTECARLIHAAERAAAATNDGQDGGGGWEKLSRLFASEYRGGDRLLVMDEPLADNLWQRIKPGLTRDDVLRVRPIGFGNAGTWRPFRLNECLKLVRYKPGDHFTGHVDGPWVPKLDESSIYTVIVYLNDDYKGGCTNFRSENTKELLWRVTPRAGQALIFNHDTYHEGEPVLEGVKYILRTEMMFQRVDTGAVVARDDYLAKPTYRKLVKVYEKSNDAIDQGDVQVFVEKYLQAIQLQREEQRSLGEDKRQLASELELPYEIYIKIFAHLSPTEIARLQLVSKLWYDLARDGPLWKKLYQARWRSLSPTGSSELQPQVSNAEIEDWYGCWKTRTREGDLETLKELLNDPANEGYTFTFMGGATPLHWAAQEGQQEALGLFLERATNAVDTKDSTGSTPLHWAADEGQVESMRQLMAKGANVNAADMEGETPLIRAALMGHLDALMFLLKSGANINATSTSGTALHAAVVNNNGECIKELIKADADPHIPNKEGKTALKMVEEKSPQLLTFFDKNTNALRDEVDSLKAGLEEWKRRALDAESKYETSQKKLMQIYNELKEAEDGLKEEKKRTEELEQKVADETQKAAEASKQRLEEQGKLREEELRTLREECEKNKATADAGELFKISQEVMKLRERLNAAENASGELAGKLAHAKIEAEVESKLRKQAEEKNRQMRTELQKLRLERGDENKLSFNTSEQALRQIEVIKRTFTSLQEVLRISEKSISHTNVQLEAFKKIVNRDRGTDEGADDDNEADDATATTENAAAEKSAQDDETQAGDAAGSAAVVEGGQREEGEPGPAVMVGEPKETEAEVRKTEEEEEEGDNVVAKAQQ